MGSLILASFRLFPLKLPYHKGFFVYLQDFLEEWQDGDELKYLRLARELVKPERSTLTVSMKDVERFNANLANTIHEEYYR